MRGKAKRYGKSLKYIDFNPKTDMTDNTVLQVTDRLRSTDFLTQLLIQMKVGINLRFTMIKKIGSRKFNILYSIFMNCSSSARHYLARGIVSISLPKGLISNVFLDSISTPCISSLCS